SASAIAWTPPVKPKLIVAISVDQFASELYRRHLPTYTKGLKTLSQGEAFPIGYQSHAATETCPGHSTILTGRRPSGTGIVGNSWRDRKTGKSVYCVSIPGSADPDARGPENLRVTTLGDWVKAAEPGARSYALSGKDRAAITMGGHHADGEYWWQDGKGFTTSSYASHAPAKALKPVQAFDNALFARWRQNPPQLWPTPPARCVAMERPERFGALNLSGHIPPDFAAHAEDGPDFLRSRAFEENLRTSPLFDSTLERFAEQVIDWHRLGHGPATDVLAVSFSANDYIGHRFGNGGPEMCEQQAALDATLGHFIAYLKGLHVPMIVVLTGDHGATDAAEREHRHDPAASRLDARAFLKRLNAHLEQALGLSAPPLAGSAEQLWIKATDPVMRGKVEQAAVVWLKQQKPVRAVFTRAEIAAVPRPAHTPPDRLTLIQRFRESYDPERSADIAVAYAPRTSFGMPDKPGDAVAGHGSPWDHDRQVPILFWWPGAPSETRATPAETVDIAPTLAALARVPTPEVDGRCLAIGPEVCGR
ncbi:MAG TPA: alkaline phosphatase family protein, partial [Sphingomonas sp.]|nr:alkaline phosphatase family protein [Sphingomonas sp.]